MKDTKEKKDDPSGRKTIVQADIRRFTRKVTRYYSLHKRDLPWRHTDDPYHILISEIMLQQTQVERVIGKYGEFLDVFPSLRSLSRAPLRKVLSVWQGMGYNRRAKNLLECARRIVREYHAVVPRNPEVLRTLPGIGEATANSLCAFAFNLPVVFIETNIRTVFIHHFFNACPAVDDREILPLVRRSLNRRNPREWYSALMDYGTFLKATTVNPGRKSTHYRKQGPFHGSNRQLRGAVLKALAGTAHLRVETLCAQCGVPPPRLHSVIAQLHEEGFLVVRKGSVRLV